MFKSYVAIAIGICKLHLLLLLDLSDNAMRHVLATKHVASYAWKQFLVF